MLETDVSWRTIGLLNDRYEWIRKTLGVTFVNSISWFEEWNFESDGLYINSRGARRHIQLYCIFGGPGCGETKWIDSCG
jgi:hypothetical protein